jgi:hypothetical protein
MRWVERLWRDDGRVKATPAGVAASLAAGVTRSTNLLRVGLEEQGLSRADRKRFESEACILECLLFEWFLRDFIVALEFGRHTDTIQQALAKRLAADLVTEAASLRRFCWISRGFVTSASPSIERRSEPVSRCRSWGSVPGCGSRTLTSRVIG